MVDFALPEDLKMKIVELVGSNVKPTLVRDLTFCEHDFGNRLVLVLPESLSGVPINLKKRQSLAVRMIGPSLNVFDMTLSRSADGGHVLKDWNSVMQTEDFEEGDTVYLWSFKDPDDILWFVMHA
ncbi:unnamed protein product [Prunus armeniaca]|uniref:TF-B3 domain-containing protein n=1 Tax=Prunus armeniaca TaxID=36596 RepID=A0A6J5XMR7_PRUAR|nr:hypothetical protein GBA52_020673 [Prunus armeniaca]CAB4313663.1 unnamed protein product [Prunus armeniaca]